MKIIITVLLATFILVSCVPTNKTVPPETVVSTSTLIPQPISTLESWTQTPPVNIPNPTPIPTLPKGVIFDKVYAEKNSAGEDFYSIISTTDGGYLITRQPNYGPCSMHKLDSTGEEEWQYAVGEELGKEFVKEFRCRSLKQITSDGYAVIGTGQDVYRREVKLFVLKFDSDGARKTVENFRWRNGMSPSLNKEGNLFWLSLFGLYGPIIETSDNGYAVVGTLLDNTLDDSMHLFRADANGNYLWERNLCRDQNIKEEWAKHIACSNRNLWDAIESQDGGFVFLGRSPGIWLMKTDANGSIEWAKSYHGADGHAVIQTSDGGFLITGTLNKGGLLIKTDANGNLQWQKILGENQYGAFKGVTMNAKGNIIVIGSKRDNMWLLSIDLDNIE